MHVTSCHCFARFGRKRFCNHCYVSLFRSREAWQNLIVLFTFVHVFTRVCWILKTCVYTSLYLCTWGNECKVNKHRFALYHDLSQKRWGMVNVDKGSHGFPSTHTFMHRSNEPYMRLFPSPRALLPVLISGPTMGRRLSWPGWYACQRQSLGKPRATLLMEVNMLPLVILPQINGYKWFLFSILWLHSVLQMFCHLCSSACVGCTRIVIYWPLCPVLWPPVHYVLPQSNKQTELL